ncbi:hypothetical protein BJV82DRAFT_326682 [Fennellomyces sp. T-0311]|nr:hypothetical protein BJV82DRAFT_326682 [Fennellomyces sp. T-0311]
MAQSLSFSELCLALDPTFATNAAETKPLCENIFDVPRSELFESYNRLREAFWTTVPIATPPVQQNVVEAPLVKRHSIEPEQAQPQRQVKRRRTETASISEASNYKELVASSLSPSLLTLWGIKRILIQQIRSSLPSKTHRERVITKQKWRH